MPPTLMTHWEDERALVHRVVVGPMDNNVFVLVCKLSGAAVMVDAANEPSLLVELCARFGVDRVLQTHGHHDHIQAVPALRAAGYPVGVAAGDAPKLPSYDFIIEDEAILEVGALRLRAIATPGHTPGSMCFELEAAPVLFGGDTLFPGGPGATRFVDSDFDAIIASIEKLASRLGPTTLVLPGHGRDTTIGAARPHVAEWAARRW